MSEAVPRVSVLMSVFDEKPALLAQAIDSILRQTFADLEFVVMDDESCSPETLAALEEASRKDSRIRLFREPHAGLTRMLNVGLARCRGEYICRQDSDDWSEPARISRQVTFLDSHPEIAIVGTQVRHWQLQGRFLWQSRLPLTSEEIRARFPRSNPFAHGSVCFRREALSFLGGYLEAHSCSQDYDAFWRLCDRFDGANLPEPLYNYRFTGASVSAKRWRDQVLAARVARELAAMRAAGRPEDVPWAVELAAQSLCAHDATFQALQRQADHYLLAGNSWDSLRFHLRAIRERPMRSLGWLKLARAVAFVAAPPLRRWLFTWEA